MLPCFFPNITFRIYEIDTAPFSVIASLVIIFICNKRYPKFLLWYLIPTIAALPWLIEAAGDWSYLFRQLAIYSTVPIVSVATYKAISAGVNINKLVKISIIIAIAGAVIQKVVSQDVLDVFVWSRGDETRGSSSFFAEPSMFGLTLIMFCMIYIASCKMGEIRFYVILMLIISLVFLAQSATAIMVALAVLSIFYVVNLSVLKMMVYGFLLAVLIQFAWTIIINYPFEESYRVISLIEIVSNNDSLLSLINTDASVSERFYHIYISLNSSIENYFLPHGFYAFIDEVIKIKSTEELLWWNNPTNKIMSGIGGAFFEIGLAAVVFIIFPFYMVFKFRKKERMTLLIAVSGAILVYLNSFNFATPYYALLIGVIAFKLHNVAINNADKDYSKIEFKVPRI